MNKNDLPGKPKNQTNQSDSETVKPKIKSKKPNERQYGQNHYPKPKTKISRLYSSLNEVGNFSIIIQMINPSDGNQFSKLLIYYHYNYSSFYNHLRFWGLGAFSTQPK